MRLSSDPRPVGYSIAIVLLLVAPYCALAGSERIGAAFAGAGALILALLSPARRVTARSTAATTTR